MHRIYTYGLSILALATVGAVGTVTTSAADAIAGVVMVVVPILLKYVKLDGPKMALLSMLTAVAVAVGAGYVDGNLTANSFSVQNLAVTAATLWAVSQAVFQLFKDSKTFGQYLK